MRELGRNHTFVAKLLHRRGDKGIDIGLLNVRSFLIALALNRPILAFNRPRNKINADIMPRPEILAKWEVAPKPNLGKASRILRIGPKIRPHQLLKARPLVGLGKRLAAILFKNLRKRCHHFILPVFRLCSR